MSDAESMVIAVIRITRELRDDGEDVIGLDADDMPVIDGVGMLTMALDTWIRTNGLRDDA